MALNLTLRKSFLYIFACIGLILVIIGGVSLVNLGLKTWVFTKADNYCRSSVAPMSFDKEGQGVETTPAQKEEMLKQCEEGQAATRQSQASNAVAMLIVGLPLYGYHWMKIRQENQV